MLSAPWAVARQIAIGLVCASSTLGCAFNRADIKSLRDRTAARIQFDSPLDTTISALNAIPSRCGPAGNRRVRNEELRVYRIEGTIVRVKRERDHDIHLVLADTMNPKNRVVVESDDPDFGKNMTSPYRDRLAAARRMFDALVSESSGARLEDLKGTVVRVTGVGFFDFNHLQVGRSRSCIELHPILAIERINSASPVPMPNARFHSPIEERSLCSHLVRLDLGAEAAARVARASVMPSSALGACLRNVNTLLVGWLRRQKKRPEYASRSARSAATRSP